MQFGCNIWLSVSSDLRLLRNEWLIFSKVNLYTRKDFKLLGIGSLYEKQFLTLNELKTSLMLKFSLENSLQSFESFILIWCERLLIHGNLK